MSKFISHPNIQCKEKVFVSFCTSSSGLLKWALLYYYNWIAPLNQYLFLTTGQIKRVLCENGIVLSFVEKRELLNTQKYKVKITT